MAVLNVNPTRMELKRLKSVNKTARKGHKLLKDKHDEMVKQFIVLARKNRELRMKAEARLMEVYGQFALASDFMGPEAVQEALMWPERTAEMEVSTGNVMSVEVPVFDFKLSDSGSGSYPYGFAFTSGELDSAVNGMCELLPILIELAQTEKTVMLLSAEIERTRRRVNALEHVVIPNQQDTIKYIMSRLDENERGNISRLMKLKDLNK